MLSSRFIILATFICALALTPVVTAADVDGGVEVSTSGSSTGLYTIEGQVRLPHAGSKFVNARVLLNGGERTGLIRSDGSFKIYHVPAGYSYTVDVAMPEFQFPTIRVDISNKPGQKGKMKATVAATKVKAAYPLLIRPVMKTEYYQKREPVNFLGMLKSPMVIMMGITLIMVVVMPRMMNSMDPQELEEMKRMQSKMSIDGWRKTLEAKATEIQASAK